MILFIFNDDNQFVINCVIIPTRGLAHLSVCLKNSQKFFPLIWPLCIILKTQHLRKKTFTCVIENAV